MTTELSLTGLVVNRALNRASSFVIRYSSYDMQLFADKHELLESSPQLLLRVRGHQVDTDYRRRRG